jgi:hypothetical protein
VVLVRRGGVNGILCRDIQELCLCPSYLYTYQEFLDVTEYHDDILERAVERAISRSKNVHLMASAIFRSEPLPLFPVKLSGR